jgi:hypothetical protein
MKLLDNQYQHSGHNPDADGDKNKSQIVVGQTPELS